MAVNSTANNNAKLEDEFLRAQTQAILSTLPAQIVGAGIFVPIVFFSLYHQLQSSPCVLYAWTIAWCLLVAFRFYSYVAVKKADPITSKALSLFWAYSRISMLLTGILWSTMIFAYADLAEPFQFIFILVCTAFTSSALISSYAASFALSIIYVGIVNLALIVKLLLSNHPEAIWLASLAAVALFVYISTSYRAQKTFKNLVETRLKEQSLAKALAAEKRVAEQANRSKSQFLAAASHDLRQPAHAMSLYVELLNKTDDPVQLAKIQEKISASLDTLREHLNALLDISRLDAGAVENTPEHFELDGLLQNLRQSFESRCQKKGLTLRVESSSAIVFADKTHLQRILENLLSNAIEYTERGTVAITATDTAEQVKIRVTDAGIGISPEDKELIFDEFFQLNNPERDKNKGFGLGLSICKKLSELMGATLELQSTVGQGSRFTLTVAAGDAAQCTVEQPTAPEDNDVSLSDLKVLVLDDHNDIRSSMRNLLLHWQASQVETAESADEAFSLIEQGFKPDLIISDYRLRQHENGVEIVQQIQRRCYRPIPTLIITGDTSARAIAHIASSGYRMLPKPIVVTELAQTIGLVITDLQAQ